jgi:hypothetical protein
MVMNKMIKKLCTSLVFSNSSVTVVRVTGAAVTECNSASLVIWQ